MSCSICWDLFNDSSEIDCSPCGHIFHSQCIRVNLSVHNRLSCPCCRNEIRDLKDLKRVFLRTEQQMEINKLKDEIGSLEKTIESLKKEKKKCALCFFLMKMKRFQLKNNSKSKYLND